MLYYQIKIKENTPYKKVTDNPGNKPLMRLQNLAKWEIGNMSGGKCITSKRRGLP